MNKDTINLGNVTDLWQLIRVNHPPFWYFR